MSIQKLHSITLYLEWFWVLVFNVHLKKKKKILTNFNEIEVGKTNYKQDIGNITSSKVTGLFNIFQLQLKVNSNLRNHFFFKFIKICILHVVSYVIY